MARRLCPTCGAPMDVEPLGRHPRRLVSYCPACNLVIDAAIEADIIEFPRSSDRDDLPEEA